MSRILKGKNFTWQIGDQPIGSGDAGEVYAVACHENPELKGVMKKPARIATGGTIQRQANQIEQESLALARLDGLPQCKAHPPRLLDEAQPFTRGTANYFMVSETAPGENFTHLLIESHQNGKPFPRRVIITVLDALFDLFSHAHHAGVLWNDVKLDHIYWHNSTGQVAVIDWGNAQFLDNDQNNQRPLPRWEDYKQLVDTLGNFLTQNAPELYADLGWDEFQGKDLDLLQVSVLARRIDYQQQVIGLRVMEYQALIRVVLSTDPSLDGLQKILNYQRILDQIGAPWETDAILTYSRTFIVNLLEDGNSTAAIKAASIVWNIFGDQLSLSWHLLREYFRIPDLISNKELSKIVNLTFTENWSSTLWNLTLIAREHQTAEWWDHIIPVIRQKALGVVLPRPYQTGLSLSAWAKSNTVEGKEQVNEIARIMDCWRHKGESLEENPFDYDLIKQILDESILPKRLASELRTGFATGQKAIRELYKAWAAMDWSNLTEAFRFILVWDPDRWGIIHVLKTVEDFHTWLKNFYTGPSPTVNLQNFIHHTILERPEINQILGTPPWLKSLLKTLTAIKQNEPIKNYRMDVEQWCPWLLNYSSSNRSTEDQTNKDAEAIQETLHNFSKHLEHWSDLDSALENVQENAWQYHAACKDLVNGFQSIANLNANLSKISTYCLNPAHPALKESGQVLHSLLSWRNALKQNDPEKALISLGKSEYKHWRIINHAYEETNIWIEKIAPLLSIIKFGEAPLKVGYQEKGQDLLWEVANNHFELNQSWQKIYRIGLNTDLFENLTKFSDASRDNLLAWRHYYEHTDDRMETLLYHSNLNNIRAISENLLRLSQHSRQAKLHFYELRGSGDIPTPTFFRICDHLLNHLSNMEEVLIPNQEERQFPYWIDTFQEINNTQTQNAKREMVMNMSQNHPLYAWLVQSLLGI